MQYRIRWWVKAFLLGRKETADLQRKDHRWTVQESSLEVGGSHRTVGCIVKRISLREQRRVPHQGTERDWHLEGYCNEGFMQLTEMNYSVSSMNRAPDPIRRNPVECRLC
ncbi:hypothetical protein TNCV_589891 [Trichonephila clavipes]|nr:hypothetical protein TNCV_589891 [Trichonephila clavipes]